MRLPTAIWGLAVLLQARPALTISGLVGYGIEPYNPPCAFACLRSLSSLTLECSETMDMGSDGMDMSSGSVITSAQCYASDSSWLTSLAWCMHVECTGYDVPASELESFWEAQATTDASVAAKWTYQEAFFNITTSSIPELSASAETLNTTSMANAETYLSQYNALTAVQRENVVESGYR